MLEEKARLNFPLPTWCPLGGRGRIADSKKVKSAKVKSGKVRRLSASGAVTSEMAKKWKSAKVKG